MAVHAVHVSVPLSLPPAHLWSAMLPVLLLGAALFLVGAIVRTPWCRGWIGELQVSLAARFLLDRRSYTLLRDVTLPAGDGTTQIDHIIVSRYGIFVIETKNMNGLIIGHERQPEWRQYFGTRFFTFQNPLHQNYKHTQTLAALLGLRDDQIVSLVVFVGGATLDERRPAHVTIAGEFLTFIKARTTEVLSAAEVERVLAVITATRWSRGRATHRAHVAHVQEIVAAKTSPAPPAVAAPPAATHAGTAMPCPICGAPMVPRTASRGARAGQDFLGCSRFPACRGTRPAETPAAGTGVRHGS